MLKKLEKLLSPKQTITKSIYILELLKGGNLGEYIKVSARFQTVEITPGFVAPEILKLDKFNPQKYGPACDLFSVGVLFHIL
jgi:hypothetical protein